MAQSATPGLDAVQAGHSVKVSKTVGEYDVLAFAGISGDFSPVHVNEEYMKSTPYGKRIAHGVLIMAYVSWATTKFLESIPYPAVSYGFDRIRFVKPVFIGDTITVEYKVDEKVPEKNQLRDKVTVTNQKGEVVLAAIHIAQFI